MKYRVAILALAALYFGFPPAQVGEKNARHAQSDRVTTATEQPILQPR